MKITDKKQHIESTLDKMDMVLKTLRCEEVISENTFELLCKGLKILADNMPMAEDYFQEMISKLSQSTEVTTSARPEIIYVGKFNNCFVTVKPDKQ